MKPTAQFSPKTLTREATITFSNGWVGKYPELFIEHLTKFLRQHPAADYDITIDHSCCWKLVVTARWKAAVL